MTQGPIALRSLQLSTFKYPRLRPQTNKELCKMKLNKIIHKYIFLIKVKIILVCYSYDGVSAGIWVTFTEVPNLGASW